MGFLVALALLEVCSLIFLLSTKGKKKFRQNNMGTIKSEETRKLRTWLVEIHPTHGEDPPSRKIPVRVQAIREVNVLPRYANKKIHNETES